VYEVNGVRWAVDLGTDDYNLPGYFGNQRWDYYRLNNRSHNTLVIGDKIQNPAADCKIISFESNKELNVVASAGVNMTDAYKGQVQSAKRTATLYKNGSVEIEDRLEGVTESVRWGMMTQATIELQDNGETAILSQKGQKIRLELHSHRLYNSDDTKKFEIVSAKPPTEAEKQNDGYSMLAVVATPKQKNVLIRVVIKPI
jgi:hypothetical protein